MNTIDTDIRSTVTDASPEKMILAAVIEQAVLDLGKPLTDDEIRGGFNAGADPDGERPDPHGSAEFLFGAGGTFPAFCGFLGLDAAWARRRLIAQARLDVDDRTLPRTLREAARVRLVRVEFFRRWESARDAMMTPAGDIAETCEKS
jgi:hypothetical protein